MSVIARARVQLLAGNVADQIAAGEVVERPASVVKELVENALDAGAHAVRVELEDGGKTLIRVSDDGSGMDREDAQLALQRHATSKIRTATDLIGVATFGFRGEALPAIASVSRFELETCGDGDAATRLRVTGGKLDGAEESARQRGTTVTVRGLFYNTPARRKFLRATATETRAAVEALTVLALTRPDGSCSVPRRPGRRDAKGMSSCAAVRFAIRSSSAPRRPAIVRRSRPVTDRRCSCFSICPATRWT